MFYSPIDNSSLQHLKKSSVFASNHNIYYEMIENPNSGWLWKFSFLFFFSDSAQHHSDVSLGTNFEFMKVWRIFEEDRRMCELIFVLLWYLFLYVVKLEGLNGAKNLVCLSIFVLFFIYRASKIIFFYCCYDGIFRGISLLYLGISQIY